jgi:hypothetical protein
MESKTEGSTMAITSIQGTGGPQLYTNPQQSGTTQIQRIGADANNQSAAATESVSSQNSSETDNVRFSNPITMKNLDTVKAIEQLHSQMNQLITGVRQTNESLNSTTEQVNRMSAPLEEITKIYPPYPVDSKKRQELLMSYTSIRQEILKMTVPAPPPAVYDRVKSTWDSLFTQNSQIHSSAVPALEGSSSDQQVKTALRQVQTTGNQLANLSSETTRALVQA